MAKTWTAEQIKALDYRKELQPLAREHKLKANGKKVDLIRALTRLLVGTENASPVQNDEEPMEVDQPNAPLNETILIASESLADSTHIIDAGNGILSKDEDFFLSADETIVAGSVNVTQTLSTEQKENVPSIEPLKRQDKSTPSASTRPSRSAETRRGVNSGPVKDRFLNRHNQEFDRMETLEDSKKKVLARHNSYKEQSKSFERLAQPKHQIIRRFRTPTQPETVDFKFGDVDAEQIETVQKPLPPSGERPSRPIRRAIVTAQEKDAKALTIRSSKTAAIVPTSRIDQLATPKSRGVPPVSAERRSFTPNKSPYRYVDTSKMSDKEFAEYKRKQKEEASRQKKMDF